MKRKILFSFIGLLALICAFLVGNRIGYSSATDQNALRTSYLAALNSVSNYVVLADVAQKIEEGGYSDAICQVSLIARARVNEVRDCMQNQWCRSMITAELKKLAPELAGQGDLRIKYYKPNEVCKP